MSCPGTLACFWSSQDLSPGRRVNAVALSLKMSGLAQELEGLCLWLCAAMAYQVAGAESPLVVNHPITPVTMSMMLSSHWLNLFIRSIYLLSEWLAKTGSY
jgi:hypothetical protein